MYLDLTSDSSRASLLLFFLAHDIFRMVTQALAAAQIPRQKP